MSRLTAHVGFVPRFHTTGWSGQLQLSLLQITITSISTTNNCFAMFADTLEHFKSKKLNDAGRAPLTRFLSYSPIPTLCLRVKESYKKLKGTVTLNVFLLNYGKKLCP